MAAIEMEEVFKRAAIFIALGVEASATVVIAFGAAEAICKTIRSVALTSSKLGQRKDIWLRFGVWLLLGLEFELAADIVRTAISPTWTDIGQLAAIGAIRTFLNHFLEKDLEKYEPRDVESQAPKVASLIA
jgi:uncharacterized membrane protein